MPDILFRPFQIKSLEMKNRIVMAPMTRNMAPGGIPGLAQAAYYARRAKAQVGLILSEGTVVDRPSSRNEPNIPMFYGEAALGGWQQVIDAVHWENGRMGPQLWHTGNAPSHSGWGAEGEMESPSGLFAPGVKRGKIMSEQDIADTVSAFARAAADAKRLGFDTIELHAAHGYLIDEFFWPGTNERADRYGGPSIECRARFAAEIVAATRAAVGSDFPIILRISQWKQQDFGTRLAYTPDELANWLVPLVEAGVDVLHCSQRRFWEPEFPEIDGPNGLNFAGWAKKVTGAATISVGSVGLTGEFIAAFGGESSQPASLDNLITRMEREEFDLIAVGRALISNPDWPVRVRDGDTDSLRGFVPADLDELV